MSGARRVPALQPRWLTQGGLRLLLLCAFIVAVGMVRPRLSPHGAALVVLVGAGLVIGAAALFVGGTRPGLARPPLLDRSQRVADSARDGLLVLDDDGRVVAANAAIGKLLGRTPAELAGMTIEELAPEDARAALAEAWAGFLGEGAAEGVFRLPGPLAPELEYV